MLTRAVLVKTTTDDGLVTVGALSPGAVVHVEMRSVHMRLLVHHATGREHPRKLVLATIDDGTRAWLPFELLRIEPHES
jgi:L-alanine-DL-glutamate epimerase-like enolase superfamily enzyme